MGESAGIDGGATGGPETPGSTAAVAQSRGGGSGTSASSPPAPAGKRARRRVLFSLGDRVTLAAQTPRYEREMDDPVYRPLQIYTIDPSRHRREGQTAEINIPFEKLRKGPKGSRFEVCKSGLWPLKPYGSVDLDDPRLLISNGHEPAPTDPVFHHQMVYAVAMTTYAAFRSALGREVSWGFREARLKLVPHAFEDANARYDRENKRLDFGWYKVTGGDSIDMPPGSFIFSCLSHDIIAHELTHALLDGLRVSFDQASNPDVSAFHEGFADLVALLQRFSYEKVVRSIIIETQGQLSKDSEWAAMVFELARGRGDAALRKIDLQGTRRYDSTEEAHDLGSILVSAILEAFVTIYSHKAEPIFRLATDGRTSLAEDETMSDDLLMQLSHSASRLATHLLNMCIRAIDYCPPVDITLGEYLRALITADRDLVPDDDWSYREALVDAFRKRHIFPEGVAALSEDALLWEPPSHEICIEGLNFGELRFSTDPGYAANAQEIARQAGLVGRTVCRAENLEIFGLADPKDPAFGNDKVDRPVVESVRSLRRVGPDRQLAFGLVAEVIQRRQIERPGYPPLTFCGGATLIIGADGEVRYVVAKNIKSEARLQRALDFAASNGAEVYALAVCRHGLQAQPPAAATSATDASSPASAG